MKDIIHDKYQDLSLLARNNKNCYALAKPFSNIYFENFFNPDLLESVLEEFPDLSQGKALEFNNDKEKKYAGDGERSFGLKTKGLMHFLNSQPFLEFLQQLTGIEETLIGDPYFFGGGLHEIKRGGLLKVHADFNKHRKTGLDRRINVLIYLNKDWEDAYGGHFELWNEDMTSCEKKIAPHFNTMAIFSTTDYSYHGHPNPLNCPENRSRKSLALYYYSNGRPASEINVNNQNHGTLFKERVGLDTFTALKPQNNTWKRVFIDFIPPILFKIKSKLSVKK